MSEVKQTATCQRRTRNKKRKSIMWHISTGTFQFISWGWMLDVSVFLWGIIEYSIYRCMLAVWCSWSTSVRLMLIHWLCPGIEDSEFALTADSWCAGKNEAGFIYWSPSCLRKMWLTFRGSDSPSIVIIKWGPAVAVLPVSFWGTNVLLTQTE